MNDCNHPQDKLKGTYTAGEYQCTQCGETVTEVAVVYSDETISADQLRRNQEEQAWKKGQNFNHGACK